MTKAVTTIVDIDYLSTSTTINVWDEVGLSIYRYIIMKKRKNENKNEWNEERMK